MCFHAFHQLPSLALEASPHCRLPQALCTSPTPAAAPPEYRHCHSQRAPTKVYERPPPQQPTISLHTTPPAHSFGPSPDQSALARPIFSRLLTPTAPSAAPSAPPPPPLPTVRPRAAVPAAASLSAARAHRRSASARLAHALPRRNCVSPLAEPASPAGLRPHPLQEASRQDGTGAHR